MKFNPQQHEAIKHLDGPLLVIAGAGSGKTRVVTSRIIHLLEIGVPADRILGVTFTNKAAGEMRDRVSRLTQAHVLICTFHSLGARILRESIPALGYRRDFIIYDSEDAEKLLKTCFQQLGMEVKKQNVSDVQNLISTAKNDLLGPNDNLKGFPAFFPQIYSLYQTKLKECQAVDFDDLIYLPVRLFQEHPSILQQYQDRWDFLHIDEYQDTNASQYTLTKLIAGRHNNVFVVGDPDQSIYGWRGADIHNILNFEKDYPGARVIRLEQNYRSTTNILDAANALVSNNRQRYEKVLWSDKGPGEKIKLYAAETERDEASFVCSRIQKHYDDGRAYRDMVVFYRTHFQSRALEDEFLANRIPYVIVGGVSFYQRREIKDLLAYLRVVHSDSDYISFARSINLPKRGLGEATLEKLRDAALQEGLGIYDLCRRLVQGESFDGIKLTTKQKGGLKNYVDLIEELRTYTSLKDLLLAAIERSGYLNVLAEEKDSEADRKENLDSLISKAAEWEELHGQSNLAAFLEELTLKSSLDEASGQHDRVHLMTLHNSKGLEFPIAFLIGLEEELFPHANTLKDDPSDDEEERRLCYVGMTRAEELLYLTHTRNRMLWGMTRRQRRSRFLKEIPSEYLERIGRFVNLWNTEEENDDNQESEYQLGDTVMHNDYGVGIIRDLLELDIGPSYRIFFPKMQVEKTLVAKYARLKRVN